MSQTLKQPQFGAQPPGGQSTVRGNFSSADFAAPDFAAPDFSAQDFSKQFLNPAANLRNEPAQNHAQNHAQNFAQNAAAPLPEALSVSQINDQAKNSLEKSFARVFVEGEVSKISAPGAYRHWYFTIKDERSSLDCAFFNAPRTAQPQVGEKIIVAGKLTVYAKTGRYQLVASKIYSTSEQGRLHEEYLRTYHRLRAEGVFERRRPLAASFESVGIITSASSAAMADMLRIRAELGDLATRVSVFDSPVQGPAAPAKLRAALARADERGFGVIIIARGGGSKEDLWAFNDEALARAIAAAKTPIISAIGHEVDQHLADFAADLSLPTPTAAARRVFFDARARAQEIDEAAQRAKSAVSRRFERERKRLEFAAKIAAKNPFKGYLARLSERKIQLDAAILRALSARQNALNEAKSRARAAVAARLSEQKSRLQMAAVFLKSSGVQKQLEAKNAALAQAKSRAAAALAARLERERARLARASGVLAASEGFLKMMKSSFIVHAGAVQVSSAQDLAAGDVVKITDALAPHRYKFARVLGDDFAAESVAGAQNSPQNSPQNGAESK